MNQKGALAQEILQFWFKELIPKQHFIKDKAVDEEIQRRFATALEPAAQGQFDHWLTEAEAALALVILLDQFPRNIFRQHPNAFAFDDKALACAQTIIDQEQDLKLPLEQRSFIYMPFMHAEDLAMQERCIALFTERCPKPDNIKFAITHRDIIQDFGRFPHRNTILGRPSTKEELAFLEGDGFKG